MRVIVSEICFKIYSFNRMPEPVSVRPGSRRNLSKYLNLTAIVEHLSGSRLVDLTITRLAPR